MKPLLLYLRRAPKRKNSTSNFFFVGTAFACVQVGTGLIVPWE
jgi:hypothetical protein